MKATRQILALTVALGVWGGVIVGQAPTAQVAPVTRQVLQKVDLGDKEGVLYVADFAPRGATGKHFHPGPETVYVLQGSGTLEMEGHPARPFKAGESFAIPAKHVHEARNASESDPWKLLVFLTGEKDQPIVTALTQPYFWSP
jgi:quercetin dioxygenase-like cupin family protein